MERKSYSTRLSLWWLLLAITLTISAFLFPGLNRVSCYAFDLEKYTKRPFRFDHVDTGSGGQLPVFRLFDLQDVRLARAKWISPLEKYTKFDEKFEISGGVRLRYERWNWFETGDLPAANDNNDYGFWGIVTNLRFKYKLDLLDAVLDIQDTRLLGLPEDANSPAPQGPLGLGALYFLGHNEKNQGRTFVNQGYLRFKDLFLKGLSLKAGRYDYSMGAEFQGDNSTLNWLKNNRLAERLVSSYGWSQVGRSFDGVMAVYDNKYFNLSASYSHPTQGGLDIQAQQEITDIDLITAYLSLKEGAWFIPDSEAGLFFIYYGDDRDREGGRSLPWVDNRPLGRSIADTDEISIYTYGIHFLGAYPLGPGTLDSLLWLVWQNGDWGNLEHKANAGAVEVGYQFPKVLFKPWLRLGYFRGSGDEDPNDGEHGTLFQLLPNDRLYASTPFYNLMNNEDLFIQLILEPMEKVFARINFHKLELTEKDDLWYQGSGATRRDGNFFGYVGRPSNRNRELANVLDVSADYELNKYFSINGYYSHLFGGDVVQNSYRGNDGDYFYLEANFRF